MVPAHRTRLRRALVALAAAAWLVAAYIAASGGFAFRAAGTLVRARRPGTALLIGAILLLGAAAAGGAAALRSDARALWHSRHRWPPGIAAAAALGAALVGLLWGTWAASGADAYGYLSQARAWAAGQTVVPQPIAAHAPWPSPEWTLSPLGWRPASVSGAIVPTYAPGLPLLMALLMAVAGDGAAFWVVPIAAAAVVWLTWRLGIGLGDRVAAAGAAVLMASSPIFLYQTVQPMSDVPVTAWWTAALVLIIRRRPVWAGLCASAAILTRPNLAPLAIWLAAGIPFLDGGARTPGGGTPDRRRPGAALSGVLAFAAAAAPGVVVWLAINRAWYGHALASGYGTFGDLFSLAHVGENARHYAQWLLGAHTPFILCGLASPLLAWAPARFRSGAPGSGAAAGADGTPAGSPPRAWRRTHVFVLVFAALVVLAYLPYAPFEEWTYLRFLLPAVPVLIATSCGVALRVASSLPDAVRVAAVAFGLAALALFEVNAAREGLAFRLRPLEHRYVATGRWVARHLPTNAVLFAVQHSGSLRYYAGRPTIRWDLLDPEWFERSLLHLRSRGLEPFLVIESWEAAQLADHLGRARVPVRLDWPPAVELQLAPRVRIYDLRDRARAAAGEPVLTRRVFPDE
jgi:hypothetical protein